MTYLALGYAYRNSSVSEVKMHWTRESGLNKPILTSDVWRYDCEDLTPVSGEKTVEHFEKWLYNYM